MSRPKGSKSVVRLTSSYICCDSCRCCIGEGFTETESYKVGAHKICGWCLGKLKARGYLQVTDKEQMLPSGSIIERH